MMRINLVTHTPDPERVVASAARLCYSPVQPKDNLGNMNKQQINEFVEKLARMGHESPLEHVSFTFTIEGVSRALSHQLVRHRIASYSQRSQRYINEEGFDFVVPLSIAQNNEASRVYLDALCNIQEAYKKLVALVPKEDARFILPNACKTSLVVTMNARALLHFFRVRCCKRAQWEIRELAETMLVLVQDVAPSLFGKAGKPCLFGPCPEGEYSCKNGSQK